MPAEDADSIQELADQWHEYDQPDSSAECALVDRAVPSAVQLRRCAARFQTAARVRPVRSAIARGDQVRTGDLKERVEAVKWVPSLLSRQPAASIDGLEIIRELEHAR